MKKRAATRAADLLGAVPAAPRGVAEFVMAHREGFVQEYNEVMEDYEKGRRELRALFVLAGDHEAGVYQHLAVFCAFYRIPLYRVEERMKDRHRSVPILVGVRAGDARCAEVEAMLRSVSP